MKPKAKTKGESKNLYLELFWNGIVNGFRAAIRNEKGINSIKYYRKKWDLDGHASTPEELRKQIENLFSKDVKNDHLLNVPESKKILINILSNVQNDQSQFWIFEPRLQSVESGVVFPRPVDTTIIDTLHGMDFLRDLRLKIMNPINLDYFLHWPLFFYYILTGDDKFMIKIKAFQFKPYRLFVVHDNEQPFWLIRSYGNANISLFHDFIKNNKSNLRALSRLLNNSNPTGRSLKELDILASSKTVIKNLDLAIMHEIKQGKNNSDYLSLLQKQAMRTGKVESSYELRDNPSLRKAKAAKNAVKTKKSRAKKLANDINRVEWVFGMQIEKLVNDINNS